MAGRKGKAAASPVERGGSRRTKKMSSNDDLTQRDVVSRESADTGKAGVVTRKQGSLSQSSGQGSPVFNKTPVAPKLKLKEPRAPRGRGKSLDGNSATTPTPPGREKGRSRCDKAQQEAEMDAEMWDDDDDDAEGNFGDEMNEDDQLDDADYVDDQDDDGDDDDGDVGTQNQSGASRGDDGDGAGEDDTRTTVSSKRRRQVNFVFTPAQERELAEWYRAYPLFYDKKNLFYKDVDKK